MSQSQEQNQQLQVKISDDVLKGFYANLVQVGYGSAGEEFILDFMNVVPPSGIVGSRIIVSPQHMKRVAAVLADNIKRYEEQFGQIKISDTPSHKIGFRTE